MRTLILDFYPPFPIWRNRNSKGECLSWEGTTKTGLGYLVRSQVGEVLKIKRTHQNRGDWWSGWDRVACSKPKVPRGRRGKPNKTQTISCLKAAEGSGKIKGPEQVRIQTSALLREILGEICHLSQLIKLNIINSEKSARIAPWWGRPYTKSSIKSPVF